MLWILPRDEQMKSFSVLCDVFSFIFWKKLKTLKRHFEIYWHLVSKWDLWSWLFSDGKVPPLLNRIQKYVWGIEIKPAGFVSYVSNCFQDAIVNLIRITRILSHFKMENSPLETPLSKWKLTLLTFSDGEVPLLIDRNPQNVRGIEIEPAGSIVYGK